MVILIPLLRRLRPRNRVLVGLACLILGAAGLAGGSVIGGGISLAVGVLFVGAGVTHRPRPLVSAVGSVGHK